VIVSTGAMVWSVGAGGGEGRQGSDASRREPACAGDSTKHAFVTIATPKAWRVCNL